MTRCATFINGDGFIEDVRDSSGSVCRLTEDRRLAAARFNRGEVRFLVSTEAAGEGVDLQESCSALVHVDLPWNPDAAAPARWAPKPLRTNRSGGCCNDAESGHRGESYLGSLWTRSLTRINLAFQNAMDDPEDIRQLVIGMASPGMFTKVFANADSNALSRPEHSAIGSMPRPRLSGVRTRCRPCEILSAMLLALTSEPYRARSRALICRIWCPSVKAILAVRGRRPDQTDSVRLRFRATRGMEGRLLDLLGRSLSPSLHPGTGA